MDFLDWIDPGPDAGLGAVFVVSFLSATLLPGGSELVLAGYTLKHADMALPAWALASIGNTLGGMSTYALARLFPKPTHAARTDWLQKHGAPALVLAWAPVVGDALCAAAGWLRMSWLPCMLWMALGKAARYGVIVWFSQ